MDIVTIDFETYYADDYTLSKLTTEAYIRDPRFEVIGVGVKVNNAPADWYSGTDPGRFLRGIDYTNKAILCHNTMFDGAILSWHFGIRPRLWLDTLSMARPLHAMTVGGSLAALVNYYDLGTKGDEVIRAKGLRRTDFTPEALNAYANYCLGDVELTYKLFRAMAKEFPRDELMVIDQTIRMYTEPKFVLDANLLSGHLADIQTRKQRLLATLGGEKARAVLMSNKKFAALLQALGAEPPMKTSKATGRPSYAFAKNDQEFLALQDHPRAAVRAVVQARLGTKSTIEETRTQRFLEIAERGPLPIMLNYYGAHTGRFSGGDKVNLQNLPRGGTLRRALTVPAGYRVVSCDSSQIEARLVAYLAGQSDLVEAFRQARDVYSEFATDVYGRQITKADKVERHLGKTCILGLGYGMGAAKFRDALATGFIAIHLEPHEAQDIVTLYRNKYPRIHALWQRCNHALGPLSEGGSGHMCDLISFADGALRLPNGMHIRYPALRREANGFAYLSDARAYREVVRMRVAGQPTPATLPWVKLYGAKVVENITQAVARIVVVEQMTRIGQRYPVALQVHDEVVCVVREAEAEACKAFMEQVMSTPPKWAPDLPVACEAGIGENYGEAH